ncbi:hypothetical protein JL722_3496 [Aureococcus anophagefferens]|nr:hypothetical protein JL722_3496 [Aureococcus anophagefferens]
MDLLSAIISTRARDDDDDDDDDDDRRPAGRPAGPGPTAQMASIDASGFGPASPGPFAADADGDGDADILTASNYDDTVAWYENDGSQSFAENVLTNSANGANFVFAADVDGDADVDVLRRHPYINWYCCYSESMTRRARAWICGFEILIFLYGTALQTNLEYPDVDDDCAARSDERACHGLKNVFRFAVAITENRGFDLTPENMCTWDLCSQVCYGKQPSDDDSEKVSHYILLVAMFALTVPCCHVFGWLFEEYLVAPTPPTLVEWFGVGWLKENDGAQTEEETEKGWSLEGNSDEGEATRTLQISFDADGADGVEGGAPPVPDEPISSDGVAELHESVPGFAVVVKESGPSEGEALSPPPPPSPPLSPEIAAAQMLDDDGLLALAKILDERGATFASPLASGAFDERGRDRVALKDDGSPEGREHESALSNLQTAPGDEDGAAEDRDWVLDLAASLKSANSAWMLRGQTSSSRAAPSASRVVRTSISSSKSFVKRSLSTSASVFFKGDADDDLDALAPLVADAVRARCAELSFFAAKADKSSRADAPRAAALLRSIKDELKETWGWIPGNAAAFEANVRSRVAKQLRRARGWDEELAEAEDATAKEHIFATHVRHEAMRSHDHAVVGACADRLDEEMEAPDEAPDATKYVLAWAAMIVINFYFSYYLITTGSEFGLRKSKVWLLQCAFALVLYFAVMKPLVVGIYYVLIPSLVLSKVAHSLEIFEHAGDQVPYATRLPASASYYLLRMHPELRGTRAGARVLGGGGAGAATVDDVIDGLHDSHRTMGHAAQDVMLVGLAFFFSFSEDIQDTIVEEVVAFFPMFISPLVSALPQGGARRGGTGEAVGMILVVLFCVVVYGAIQGVVAVYARAARCCHVRMPKSRAEREFLSAARAVFDMIDVDGNGSLDRAEIVARVSDAEARAFLRDCGNETLRGLLVPERLEAALGALDTNSDGRIDAREWESAIEVALAKTFGDGGGEGETDRGAGAGGATRGGAPGPGPAGAGPGGAGPVALAPRRCTSSKAGWGPGLARDRAANCGAAGHWKNWTFSWPDS